MTDIAQRVHQMVLAAAKSKPQPPALVRVRGTLAQPGHLRISRDKRVHLYILVHQPDAQPILIDHDYGPGDVAYRSASGKRSYLLTDTPITAHGRRLEVTRYCGQRLVTLLDVDCVQLDRHSAPYSEDS